MGVEKQRAAQRQTKIKERATKEARGRLKKIVKDLEAIDTEKMSPLQAEPVRKLLEGLDLVKRREKTMISLQETRKYLEDNPEAEMPDYMLEKLTRLDKDNLNDITLEDLEDIHYAVMHHVHLEKKKKQIRVRKEHKRTEQVLNDSIAEMKPVKKLKDETVSSQEGGLFAGVVKGAKWIKNLYGIRSDHYDLIIEKLAGPNSMMDKVLYQEVKEGITTQREYRQNTFKQFQKDVESLGLDIPNIVSWLNKRVKTGRFNFTRGEEWLCITIH